MKWIRCFVYIITIISVLVTCISYNSFAPADVHFCAVLPQIFGRFRHEKSAASERADAARETKGKIALYGFGIR